MQLIFLIYIKVGHDTAYHKFDSLMFCSRILLSLPIFTQHLLVLLFGTFRVIHSNSERANTGMTAEALGVSVAPSFFHTCVMEGKIARPEEVQKFKVSAVNSSYDSCFKVLCKFFPTSALL